MSSDDIVLNGIIYERDTSGAWIDLEPAEYDGAVWVGPALDDPQLCAALDEIERLRAICEDAYGDHCPSHADPEPGCANCEWVEIR